MVVEEKGGDPDYVQTIRKVRKSVLTLAAEKCPLGLKRL